MSDTPNTQTSDRQEETYRYERKFVLDHWHLAELRMQVKLHPVLFRRAYAPRYVNNLYFDSRDQSSFFDNIEGVSERTKMRVRWYGDLLGTVDRPILEFKIKRGVVGTKRRVALSGLDLSEYDVGKTVTSLLKTAPLPDVMRLCVQQVEPTLLNRYHREYFESARGFRLTIDRDLQYFPPNHVTGSPKVDPIIVVELKYDREQEFEARGLLSHFGLRVMKNSKYVAGLI